MSLLSSALCKSILAIAIGSALGALFRWFLALRLNTLLPGLPMGTLAANLIGGYIIGVAIASFAAVPSISPVWRVLITTGFCGGLTTFSTFSVETVGLLQAGRIGWALAGIGANLIGSLCATSLGLLTVRLVVR
jgi:CrcB protein